jgi:bifunctional non-homologous end joining protein LigD
MAGSNWPTVEGQVIKQEDELQIDDCMVRVSDIDREIWKGIPKAKLIQYYHSISGYILPYLKDRPQSLHLKLAHANAPGLYIKDMEGRQTGCADIFTDTRRHREQGKREQIDYLVCNNEATLLWMINVGCIDINPWNARMQTPDHPDYIVIDLDPTVKDNQENFLGKLIDTALATKDFCDRHKLHAFAKTSGKTGVHFYLPCTGIMVRQARNIAEMICRSVADTVPESATFVNSINARGNKVYVDPSQNDYADTLAAPYSVRPYPIPTVSTPLEWKEINGRLDPSTFSFDKTLARIKKKGDLFQGVLDRRLRPQIPSGC